MISSNSQLSSLVPSWTPGVMTDPSSALWHEIQNVCWASREWARHIPSKLAGKCTEMPKNMTRIMIRFVLTVAATVIPTARRGREKSEGWLQIWWYLYLEIRASQVNNNKQFGMKSTRNCLPPLSIESQQTNKKLTWKLWSLFSRNGKTLSHCRILKSLEPCLKWLKGPGPMYFDCNSWYHPHNNLNGDGEKKYRKYFFGARSISNFQLWPGMGKFCTSDETLWPSFCMNFLSRNSRNFVYTWA